MTNEQSEGSGSEAGLTRPSGQSVNAARSHVEHLLAAFLADPGGDAGQMARAMLLNYLVKEQMQQEEQAQRELQYQKEKQAVLEEDVGTLAVKRLNADTRNQKLGVALQ
jgi:hypothetical protein